MIVECKLNTLRQLKFFDGRTPALVFESLPSGDDQLLSIVYRYLANDPSFPSFLERKIKSRRIELSLSLSALFHLDSPPYFSRHSRRRRKSSLPIYFTFVRGRESRIIKWERRMERKESRRKARFVEAELRASGILPPEPRHLFLSTATITTSPHSSTIPHYSPSRFATMITGRSVVSRCNGSNPDRLYPRAGSLPPKVPPRPRPCRLEPGNRNCSISSIR